MTRRELEFGCSIVIVGLLAGLAGMATTVLLHFIEHLTYAFTFGSLLDGVTGSSPVRRAVGPLIGGALAGFGWWILRRHHEVPALASTISNHRAIPRVSMTLDAALQVLVVGSAHPWVVRAHPAKLPRYSGTSAPRGGHSHPTTARFCSPAPRGPAWVRCTACRSAGPCSRSGS